MGPFRRTSFNYLNGPGMSHPRKWGRGEWKGLTQAPTAHRLSASLGTPAAGSPSRRNALFTHHRQNLPQFSGRLVRTPPHLVRHPNDKMRKLGIDGRRDAESHRGGAPDAACIAGAQTMCSVLSRWCEPQRTSRARSDLVTVEDLPTGGRRAYRQP
jgi:hypothetical protein